MFSYSCNVLRHSFQVVRLKLTGKLRLETSSVKLLAGSGLRLYLARKVETNVRKEKPLILSEYKSTSLAFVFVLLLILPLPNYNVGGAQNLDSVQ